MGPIDRISHQEIIRTVGLIASLKFAGETVSAGIDGGQLGPMLWALASLATFVTITIIETIRFHSEA